MRLPLLLLLFLPPGMVQAADVAAPGVSSGAFLQATLGLGLIIGLLLLFAFLARKFLGGKGFGQGGLKLLGGVALGPKERIILLEAGDQWLVVGIVPGQIRTLHTMPKGEIAAEAALAPPPFSLWLQQIMERRNHDK